MDYWQLSLAVWLITLTWLIVLAVIDYKTKTLPYKITLPLLVFQLLSVVVLWQLQVITIGDRLLAVAIFAGIFGLLWLVSGGRWVGDGDIPLLAVMALQLGLLGTFFAIFIGSSVGSIIAITLILANKRSRSETLAFGPLLIIGTIIVVLVDFDFANNLLL